MKTAQFSHDAQAARSLCSHLKHWLGLDRAIAFTVLARFCSAAAGIATILLITRFLSQAEQGYYYTISSLVALQIVFELGFSFVILQLAAHERAQLVFLPDGSIFCIGGLFGFLSGTYSFLTERRQCHRQPVHPKISISAEAPVHE